jgi:hypothetical protein
MERGNILFDCLLGVEQSLWASELLVSNRDDVAVGKLKLYVLVRGFRKLFHFVFVVEGDVALFFFDGSDYFEFSG